MSKLRYIFLVFALLFGSLYPVTGQEAVTKSELNLLNAVKSGRYEATIRGLEQNLSPNLTDEYGVSLLMFAISNKDTRMIDILLGAGANINYRISGSDSPSDNKSPVKMLLLKHKSVLDFAIEKEDTQTIIKLVGKGVKLNESGGDGYFSPLFTASKMNNVGILEYLSVKGAKVSKKSASNILVWSIVSNWRAFQGGTAPFDLEVIRFWEEQGVDVSYENLLKTSAAKNLRTEQKTAMRAILNTYQSWDDKPQEKNRSPQLSVAPIETGEGYTTNDFQEQIELLKKDALQKKETQDKVENTYRNSILVISIVIFTGLVVVYRKYGSLEWQVWVALFSKLSKQVSNQSNSPNPPNQNTTNTSPPNSNNRRNVRNAPPKPVSKPIEKKPKPTSDKIQSGVSLKEKQQGWSVDNTLQIKVEYLTIEDMVNPIRLCNEHEKAIRKMMWYMRRLENHTDEQIAQVLGPKGLLPHLNKLWLKIDDSMVRHIYKHSLFLLAENYAIRDKRVLAFIDTMNSPKSKMRRGNKPKKKSLK